MVKAGVVQCGDDWHIEDGCFSRELLKDFCTRLLVTSLNDYLSFEECIVVLNVSGIVLRERQAEAAFEEVSSSTFILNI